MKKLLMTILSIVWIFAAQAQEKFVARINFPTVNNLEEFLTIGYDIAAFSPGKYIDLVIDQKELLNLEEKGYSLTITQTESQLKENLVVGKSLTGYRSYSDLLNELQSIQAAHPSICKLYDVGNSNGKDYTAAAYIDYKHDIWAMKISDNVATEEDEPCIFYIGAHHAREPISLEVTMYVLNYIVSNYGTDPTITNSINNKQIWFLPLANPDGHKIVTNEIDVWWRKNIRDNNNNNLIDPDLYPDDENASVDGVDENRNYGWQWGGEGSSGDPTNIVYRGPNAFSEPETMAIKNILDQHHFVAGITYHSYSELVLFPYGYSTSAFAPDQTSLAALASNMANSIPAAEGGYYTPDKSSGLYPSSGTTEDYAYGQLGIFTYCIELGTEFIPPASEIPTICANNLQAALILMNRVDKSTLTGIIKDAATLIPIQAKISISGIDNTGGYREPYISDANFGRYYRFLPDGYYNVTFSSYGYIPQTFTSVNINNIGQTILNVDLIKGSEVSSVIDENTVWDQAGSPYIVTSSITINHNVTLTIQPGVVVKFNNGQGMQVNGTLDATNTTFTSNSSSPSPGIWSTIQTGGSNPLDEGTIIMNNCQVLYASYFYVTNGTAYLTNTDLLNFFYYGALVESNGTLHMSGGSINTNSSWAVTNGSGIIASTNAHSTFSGVSVQHFQYGVQLNNNSVVDISNINIFNCTWPVYYSASADLTASGTNNFSGNTHTAVNMAFYSFSDTLSLPYLNIPYFFQSGLTVNAGGRMIVGSNNILKFPGSALDINGTLIAEANEGEYIYFTSYQDDNWGGDTNNDGTASAPASGNWYGVRFQETSNDANCLMRRCKIRYGGAGNTGGISMFNASPTIDFCDISNNYYGAYLLYASNPQFTNNTIGSSQWTPIAMSFEANPIMTNNTLSFSDNAYDAIGLIGGTLTENAVISKRSVTNVPNITYLMLDQITIPVGKALTINKGIVIKSYSNTHRIIVEGTMNAIATADSMITFTSASDDNYGNPGDSNKDGTITSPAIGNRGTIIFKPGSTGTLNYCRIKYSNNYNYYFSTCNTSESLNDAAVCMIDANPTISNCEFKDLNYGISCYRASNPAISNNNMINIAYTPFCISGSSDPVFTGNTFTNVGLRALGLLGGNVCLNGTIKKRDVAGFSNITYVLLADMYINSETYVNVESGVVIKSNQYFYNYWYCSGYYGYNIYVDGGFKTDGSIDQHVIFTSIKDDNQGNPFDTNGDGNATTPTSGNWGYIKFNASSDDAYCNLNYADIKYAGYYGPCNAGEGSVAFENAGGQINNSTITNSSTYGVFCNGNSTPILNNVNIQNCSLDPVAMSLLSDPTMTNITFSANGSKAIKIIEGTLSTNATLAPRNVAGITNIAYIIGNLTISSNAKLTIQPGVVIKFRPDNYSPSITVNGNLIANGLSSNNIYFTSFADDSKGGDSNNNGNASGPYKGDWGGTNWTSALGGIRFVNNNINSDTVNSMKYCEISYACTGVLVENSHVTMEHCLIQQASYYGATIIGSANPDFVSTEFYNIQYSPIELSMFSAPTFVNCIALNVGYMALSVIPETYSQTATIPVRNFGGYNNINYFLKGTCTVNSGTTITIPAGIVFKSTSATGFNVNGRLNIEGTTANPVVFTNDKDDSFGNPGDMNQDGSATQPPNSGGWSGTWINFNDVSDDLSSINHVVLRYGDNGIATLSASPLIDHVRFEYLYSGVFMYGVSAPLIDYCIFNNLMYYPIQISLVSYPASTLNNSISGSTYKVIKVLDETLTQDVTLPKRTFGGISNIPYCFGYYTIGTGATLTISPGIVCKFKPRNYYWETIGINVQKGLIVLGGASPDSNIVFTSLNDDFYGGDSNSDSTLTLPYSNNWDGLIFQDQSLDPLCKLKNCIIRYADKAIKTTSASPSLENCNINNNYYGVYATAASNPVFNNCDFNDNYYFAIDNVDKSFVINAKNCWWGSNLGPIQTDIQGNGTSIQELVTTSVDYTPWKTTGAGNPLMGDVSLNGIVQAYDASLVMQNVVGNLTLTSTQVMVANVSGAAGVTAYDASLILQYDVGLIQYFPAELTNPYFPPLTNAQLVVGSASVEIGDSVTIPLKVINGAGMVSTDINLEYDPEYLHLSKVTNLLTEMSMTYSNDSVNGILSIAVAGINPLSTDTTMVQVTFNTMLPNGMTDTTAIIVKKFLANESDLTSGAINGGITITNSITGTLQSIGNTQGEMFMVYPNPSTGNTTLNFELNGDNQLVSFEIFNLMGQKIVTIEKDFKSKGKYTLPVLNQGNTLENGTYLIRMSVDGYSQTKILQVVR